MSLIMHLLFHIENNQDTVNDLIATGISLSKYDGMKRTLVRLVLKLYTPRKPLCISADDDEICAFLNAHLSKTLQSSHGRGT